MTICLHEIKQGRIALLVWTGAISLMLAVCILIYPDMASDMGDIGEMFADMGSFSAAFGMDRINFGEFSGFFCVECGNVLGLGGAFFAALIGVSALAKEEKEHTAEFLLTHPVPRVKVIAQKLMAVVLEIVILNAVVIAVTLGGMAIIDEHIPSDIMVRLFFAYFVMQLETASISFGISAFLTHNTTGIGLGLAAIFYFLNIVSNLTEDAAVLKYITPFGYTDGADIIANGALAAKYLVTGIVLGIIGIACAFVCYTRRDIR